MDAGFLKTQWDAFWNAPVPAMLFLAVGAIAAWWLKNTVDKGQIDALKEKHGVLEERARLIADKVAPTVEKPLAINVGAKRLIKEVGIKLEQGCNSDLCYCPIRRMSESGHDEPSRCRTRTTALEAKPGRPAASRQCPLSLRRHPTVVDDGRSSAHGAHFKHIAHL